jgi:hypothetical protein
MKLQTVDQALGPFGPLARTRQSNTFPDGKSTVGTKLESTEEVFTTNVVKRLLVETWTV